MVQGHILSDRSECCFRFIECVFLGAAAKMEPRLSASYFVLQIESVDTENAGASSRPCHFGFLRFAATRFLVNYPRHSYANDQILSGFRERLASTGRVNFPASFRRDATDGNSFDIQTRAKRNLQERRLSTSATRPRAFRAGDASLECQFQQFPRQSSPRDWNTLSESPLRLITWPNQTGRSNALAKTRAMKQILNSANDNKLGVQNRQSSVPVERGRAIPCVCVQFPTRIETNVNRAHGCSDRRNRRDVDRVVDRVAGINRAPPAIV